MRRSSHTIRGSIRSAFCSLLIPWKSKHCRREKREPVLDVIEDGVVNAFANPFREIPIQLLRQEEIRETAILRIEQVHIPDGFVDYVIVFRLQFRAAIGQQQLDEGIEKRDIALGRLQCKWIDARAVFADAVHSPAIEFHDTFVAAAYVEDVGEPAILLLVGDGQIAVYGFACAGWPEDEHDPHAVHVGILEERRPRARLEDVQVLVVEVFRVAMAQMRSEDRRQSRMVILRQPHRKDIELVVAGEHGIERRQISECLFHDLRPRIDEGSMHGWRDAAQFIHAACGHKEAKRELALRLLVERTNDFAEVIDLRIGGARSGSGIKRREIPSAHHARQHSNFEERDELLLRIDLAARRGRGLRPPSRAQHAVAVERRSPENRQGRDASGVVLSENIWTYLRPIVRWSLCHSTGLFTIWRSTPLSLSRSSVAGPFFEVEQIAEELIDLILLKQLQSE